jgi:ATP-dependent DNA helicase PIF1
MQTTLDLSFQQQEIINQFNQGCNLFITGGAGTGKSYLLNYLKRNYNKSGLAVTASTGIAAVNIGGSTIHSWAGIGLGNLPADQIISNLGSHKFSKLRKKIRLTNILAIDEISMIPAQTFELLDKVFKSVRENNLPFGSLQLALFGDFLQLPPVNNYNNKTEFCFKSQVWQELNLTTVILEKIFRQNDQKFIKILNNLRFGKIDEEDIELLTSRININDSSIIKPTLLTTHNHKVEQINQLELKKIPQEEVIHSATYAGNPDKIEFLRKNCLASEHLKLKVGAQVMMIKNTYQKDEIINGSLGIIRDFSPKKLYPIVEFANNKILTIAPSEWNIEKFDEEKREMIIEASLTQIPLILAWAMTIHKSQGLTLDKINCDLSQVFSPAQIYVALSRTRSLNSVFLTALNFNKISADPEALNFYKSYLKGRG